MLPDPTGKHVSQHVRLSAPGRRRPPRLRASLARTAADRPTWPPGPPLVPPGGSRRLSEWPCSPPGPRNHTPCSAPRTLWVTPWPWPPNRPRAPPCCSGPTASTPGCAGGFRPGGGPGRAGGRAEKPQAGHRKGSERPARPSSGGSGALAAPLTRGSQGAQNRCPGRGPLMDWDSCELPPEAILVPARVGGRGGAPASSRQLDSFRRRAFLGPLRTLGAAVGPRAPLSPEGGWDT